MSNMDLQDEVRMNDTYYKLNSLLEGLKTLDVFPSLTWLWAWDVVVDKFENYSEGVDDEYTIATGMTLPNIFKRFWEDADQNGFTLEFGTEDLDESIFDWMIDKDILVMVESGEEEE